MKIYKKRIGSDYVKEITEQVFVNELENDPFEKIKAFKPNTSLKYIKEHKIVRNMHSYFCLDIDLIKKL